MLIERFEYDIIVKHKSQTLHSEAFVRVFSVIIVIFNSPEPMLVMTIRFSKFFGWWNINCISSIHTQAHIYIYPKMARHKQFWVSPPAKVRPHPPPCPSSEIKKKSYLRHWREPWRIPQEIIFWLRMSIENVTATTQIILLKYHW